MEELVVRCEGDTPIRVPMCRMAQIQRGRGGTEASTEETRHQAKASREVRHAESGSLNDLRRAMLV